MQDFFKEITIVKKLAELKARAFFGHITFISYFRFHKGYYFKFIDAHNPAFI